MPTKAKETAAARNARLRSEIEANIERIGTLMKEDKREPALQLGVETQEVIAQLPKIQHKGLEASLTEALAAHPEEPEGLPAPKTYRDEIEDSDAEIDAASQLLARGYQHAETAADAALELAKHMITVYEQFTNRGAPDLMANSQHARDFASDVKADARRKLIADNPDLDEDDCEAKLNSFWALYKRRASDLRAQLANGLDDHPDEFRERFPQAAEQYPDMRPSEALSHFYELDLLGYSERQRRAAKLRRLKSRLALAEGPDAQRIEAEIADLEGKPAAKEAPEPDWAQVAVTSVKALRTIDTDRVKELDDEHKRTVRAEAEAAIEYLKTVVVATL